MQQRMEDAIWSLKSIKTVIFWQISVTADPKKHEGLYVGSGLFVVLRYLPFHGNMPITCNQGDLL